MNGGERLFLSLATGQDGAPTNPVRFSAPLRDLLDTVNSADAELLVVGARGAIGVRYLLLGSVAEGALNRCPVPVLVVR